MNKIWVLQNIQPENLGIAGQVFQGCGLAPAYIHTFAGEEVPRYMDGAAGLVVLGGPMGVYEHDRYPFLDAAMRLIDQALKEDKPVLGICLGSQLLATALGARVARGSQKEIGWYPIERKPSASEDPLMGGLQPSFMGFHWHGDIFDLPKGRYCTGFFCPYYLPSVFLWPGGVWRPLPHGSYHANDRRYGPSFCRRGARGGARRRANQGRRGPALAHPPC